MITNFDIGKQSAISALKHYGEHLLINNNFFKSYRKLRAKTRRRKSIVVSCTPPLESITSASATFGYNL